ncbi:MAG: carboxylesterase family protein [Synergistes sp.]|nr:carboxylesterase family protein [Synergistes sp.]
MKKMLSVLLCAVTLLLSGGCLTKSEAGVDPIYRSREEWEKRFSVPEYAENKKLKTVPDGRPSVTCVNGTFVGNTVDGVDVFKGIPFAQAPVGDLRFVKAQSVLPSDEIYDASYFGMSFMQPVTNGEAASAYKNGEDCLRLNVWNNTQKSGAPKPVLVYIHGGGFNSGGTSDPLYDGWNFAHYNPDIIVVTITYRAGMLGFMNLSGFEDGADYKYAMNNAFYDQIEALRWIKANIAQFGGDPNNITVCGESAGGCAVSVLCVMDEAKGLFGKAIAMSGAVNLCVTPEHTLALTDAVRKDLKVNSVKELKEIPFEDLRNWWIANMFTIYNHPCMDGVTLDSDLFKLYRDGKTKDLIIMQGHTKDEFRYYYTVFNNCLPFYQAVCDEIVKLHADNSSDNFKKLYKRYKRIILSLGYTKEDVNRCFADDMSLAISNTYQAILHANAGGKGYSYTFAIPYDNKFNDFELGAAHAVDCSYLFGNFDGLGCLGTDEEVDASIRFQKMIANFCKTGDPSTKEIKWPLYENKHRNKLNIEASAFTVVENPEKERVNLVLKILKQMRSPYSSGLAPIIAKVYADYPEAVKAYRNTMKEVSK